jgi:hypothetical protein
MTTAKYDLQDVLDAVMLAEPEPSHEALVRWMKRYPGFGKELEKFFVSWSESEMWKHLSDSVEIDDEAITERAIKRTLAKQRNYERTR